MAYEKINLVYFSATGTTAKIVSAVADGTEIQERTHHKILFCPTETISIPDHETVIFGVPVFSGRVPAIAINALEKFIGHGTPAIIVCVYGNRDFDDALLELKNSVERRGFVVVSAGAFIAQHSIFPHVGEGRPDSHDLQIARDFGRHSMEGITAEDKPSLSPEWLVQGNFPYRDVKKIPLSPEAGKKCNLCGVCAKQCPVQAIHHDDPRKVDKKLCMACAHCISVCPQQVRRFRGLLYRFVAHKFVKKCALRQEPYLIYR